MKSPADHNSGNHRHARHKRRRLLAVVLTTANLIFAGWIISWNLGSRHKADEYIQFGRWAENNGNYASARYFYLEALGASPLDQEIRLRIARIEDRRLGENEAALMHYKRLLTMPKHLAVANEVKAEAAILSDICSGKIEDPWDAIKDMFMFVAANSFRLFQERLHPDLPDDPKQIWSSWQELGAGVPSYRRITETGAGVYQAEVYIEHSQGMTLSILLECREKELWRLKANFPY